MVHITLSDKYADLIAGETLPILLKDPQGRLIGQVGPVDEQAAQELSVSAEHMAEVRRRMERHERGEAKWYTWPEIKAHLESLDA